MLVIGGAYIRGGLYSGGGLHSGFYGIPVLCSILEYLCKFMAAAHMQGFVKKLHLLDYDGNCISRKWMFKVILNVKLLIE